MLSVRVFSSCMYLCSIVFICAFLPLVCTFVQDKNNWTNVQTRRRYAQIKTIEQRYIQEENTRTDKDNWTSIISICACVFFLFVHLFNCFYLYVCFLLYALLFYCFYLCVYFLLVCTKQLNKGAYKRKTHAQIKTTEQRYKQEEDKRTDKNNWTKVHTRGKHTHR
jgi:ABC-type protease/lipase transport system fused ATPase/permease subunit